MRKGTIELACGPRAAEARLLELLGELRDEARRDPSVLRRPVRVIVPSRSLRRHVCERVAAELGATLGVEVQTHFAAAIEVLERAGARAGGGDALVEVLARRAAAEEPALREACAPFRDGYRPVAASVRDLLDAGLVPEGVEAAAECLAETPVADADLRRAQAVVRVAGAVAGQLRGRDFAGRQHLLARAREVYLEAPGERLPTRALLVHGFADLTGRASDLVEALVSGTAREGGRALVLVDLPPDPAEPGTPAASASEQRADRGAVFTERLVERLSGSCGKPRWSEQLAPPPAVELFRAPGAVAEVREVGRRLRAAMAAGARPERCGVVARDLGPYRAALRTHFARLGLPFSGLRARAPMDGPSRRLAALLELLEQGPRTPVDRWLDATRGWVRGDDAWRPPSEELRLGLRLLGGLTLAEVAGLDLPQGERVPLPLRRGVGRLFAADGDGPAGGERHGAQGGRFAAFRLKLATSEVAGTRELAERTRDRLAGWPGRGTLARHLALLEGLCAGELGWRETDPETLRLRAATGELAEDLTDEVLEREEFLSVLTRLVDGVADGRLGGEGGGVQVLEVMEARGRTFDHLFVLGLNRDAFPRTVREDPLLGDDLRRALTALLPEIPVKARGRDEERYLFAQLLACASRVTLSWQVADDDGRARVASPLLVRLLGERGDASVPQVPAAADLDEPGPHTAREAALRGGLGWRTRGYRERLEAALSEAGRGPDEAAEVAGVRARVLEAFERGPFEPGVLAPWLGFLGAQDAAGVRPDPRSEPFYVTRLEGLARCPWQTVLTRFLKLERPPDPVEDLPTVDARSIGNVVHKVLERVAVEAGAPVRARLQDVLSSEGCAVGWPDGERLEALLAEAARAELERDCRPLDGHVRLLAACSRELVLRAGEFLQAEARRFEDGRVLGVEIAGSARVPLDPGELRIEFQADRVERREGRVVLSDHKTGKPKARSEFVHELAAGLALQPGAYALAAAELERERGSELQPKGRYLFYKADPGKVEVDSGLGLGSHGEAFARAAAILVRAWTAGALFPRLVEPDGSSPQACRSCEVGAACLQGDSGARRAVSSLGRAGTDDAGAAAGLPPEAGELFRLHPKVIKAEAKQQAKASKRSLGKSAGKSQAKEERR